MFRLLIALAVFWGPVSLCFAQEQPETEEQEAGATGDIEAKATQSFEAGVKLADAGDCAGAVAHFEASVHRYVQPAPLLALARCEEKLLRFSSAVEHYERYLELAEDGDDQKPGAERSLNQLNARLGTLKIRAAIPAQIFLEGQLVGKAPGEILLPAGHHILEFRIDGHAAQRRSVELRARKQSEVFVEIDRKLERAPSHSATASSSGKQVDKALRADAESDGLDPTIFWIGAGLTVATAAAGTVFGLQARSKRDEAEEIDPRISREAEIEDIQTASRTADLLFGTAAVLGVATAIAALFTNWEGDRNKPRESQSSAGLELTPTVSPRALGLTIQGEM